MALVGISSELSMHGYTMLENIFISEYMPFSPDHCVKVYIYGLFLASAGNRQDNDIDAMSRVLSLDAVAIRDAYSYWQASGLVQIMSKEPLEVKYLPIKSNISKKYKTSKYMEFNDAMNGIIAGRMITSNEFYEYYSAMETYHIEPMAMIMIAKYCASIKGDNIGYPYIITVARNWATEGVTTIRSVEDKLKAFELLDSGLTETLKAMGIKRSADVEERQLYHKFTKEMGFDRNALIYAAKKCKKGGFQRLEKKLAEYYSARLMDAKEMADYDKRREELFTLCRTVNKLIGVYYEQIDHEVETYIAPWTAKGFDDNAITMIADYCFKSNIRNLEGMNTTINKLFKQGLITVEAISEHLSRALSVDVHIREVLNTAGLTKNVSAWDRDSYRTWTYSWKMSHELVMKAAELACGKAQPIPYMNRILSDWRDKKYITIQDIKEYSPPAQADRVAEGKNRVYSKEEWDALIDNLENVEI